MKYLSCYILSYIFYIRIRVEISPLFFRSFSNGVSTIVLTLKGHLTGARNLFYFCPGFALTCKDRRLYCLLLFTLREYEIHPYDVQRCPVFPRNTPIVFVYLNAKIFVRLFLTLLKVFEYDTDLYRISYNLNYHSIYIIVIYHTI